MSESESIQQKLGRVVQQRLDKSYRDVHRKGHERLTIMLIPHGKEKIFSLHLNWLMILFLTGAFLSAIFLSGYGLYRHALKQREIEQLRNLYGLNYKYAQDIQLALNKIRRVNAIFQENLFEISEALDIPERELAVIPLPTELDKHTERNVNAEAFLSGSVTQFIPPVYSLRFLNIMLDKQWHLIHSLSRSVNDGLGIYDRLPMGRPFKSFNNLRDTSLYGIRLDPVRKSGREHHAGFDTSGRSGTAIYATGDGVVERIKRSNTGYGNSILIRHINGYYSFYAHLSHINVRRDNVVSRGAWIGKMGRSGRTTGPHLHYEIREFRRGVQKRINPIAFVCARDLSTRTCKKYHAEHRL